LRNFARCDVRDDADDAFRAHGHERDGERIVATENFKARAERSVQLADTIATAAGFFDADDVFAGLCKTARGLHTYLHATPAGNAVEHDGQFRVASDFAEVLEQPFLRRFVVIGPDLQRAVGAEFLCFAREINRLTSGVRSGAGENLDLARG